MNFKSKLANSINGLMEAWSDLSFRAEIFAGLLLVPVIILSTESTGAKLAVVGTYLLLVVIELINTALERLCDRITLEHDPAIKAVKDMGSAAVFIVVLLLIAQITALFL